MVNFPFQNSPFNNGDRFGVQSFGIDSFESLIGHDASPIVPKNPIPARNSSAASKSSAELPSNTLKQVTFNELIQSLETAIDQQQAWVNDFGDDPIMLTSDLYDVIKEFARLQKPVEKPGRQQHKP